MTCVSRASWIDRISAIGRISRICRTRICNITAIIGDHGRASRYRRIIRMMCSCVNDGAACVGDSVIAGTTTIAAFSRAVGDCDIAEFAFTLVD